MLSNGRWHPNSDSRSPAGSSPKHISQEHQSSLAAPAWDFASQSAALNQPAQARRPLQRHGSPVPFFMRMMRTRCARNRLPHGRIEPSALADLPGKTVADRWPTWPAAARLGNGIRSGGKEREPAVYWSRPITRTFRRPASRRRPNSRITTSRELRSGLNHLRTRANPEPTANTAAMTAITGTRITASTPSSTSSPAPTVARITHEGWRLTAWTTRKTPPGKVLNDDWLEKTGTADCIGLTPRLPPRPPASRRAGCPRPIPRRGGRT
jgi:hypothetical protein